ncbi:MAG: methyl-accepting chemotaxis protein [Xylophilus ampelinus]
MNAAVLIFCAGCLLGGLALGLPLAPRLARQRRELQDLRARAARAEASEAREAARIASEDGAAEVRREAAERQAQALRAELADARAACEDARHAAGLLHAGRGDALRHAGALAAALQELQGVEMTLERWHDDMTRLLDHNRLMHAKNDDFSQIVRQMVMVGLNASIEAAHAGHTGRGFGVVATEMRELSARAELLSADYRRSLYENDLIATTTFQDMQAGGRMIVGALRGLELGNRRSMELLAAPAEAAA